MKNLLVLVGFILTMAACEEESSKQGAKIITAPQDTLTYLNRHLLRTYGNCQDPEDYTCTHAEVKYLLITGGVTDIVRKRINQTILSNLQGEEKSLEDFLDRFLNEYHEYVESDFEFMDEEPGWFYEGRLNMALNDVRVLTLAHQEYEFTGGAHGNYQTKFWHFNCQTGMSLNLVDLIQPENEAELTALGEHYFRLNMHLREDGSINESTGFSFPDDEFYLPPVYALLPQGLTFTFGTYEISSYAEGEIQFSIPYEELARIAKKGSILEDLVKKPPFFLQNGS
ncbi:MAG: DUF3298 and DUF4163 domain-containing protein [Saprospiraceae bacterium]|nr:DUF3298 and DUF4163 domain-containing protein [Saprospiraceae bacterium]